MRLRAQIRAGHSPHCLHLRIAERSGAPAISDHSNHTRSGYDWRLHRWIEAAKDVTRKERPLGGAPGALLRSIGGNKFFITLAFQDGRDAEFESGLDLNCKPKGLIPE